MLQTMKNLVSVWLAISAISPLHIHVHALSNDTEEPALNLRNLKKTSGTEQYEVGTAPPGAKSNKDPFAAGLITTRTAEAPGSKSNKDPFAYGLLSTRTAGTPGTKSNKDPFTLISTRTVGSGGPVGKAGKESVLQQQQQQQQQFIERKISGIRRCSPQRICSSPTGLRIRHPSPFQLQH
mmetsp:Transcript_27472/g.56509  ORF Transcript_27472/g.56509 Transcript_27472/m.56509 type:complete len:180 (+) Transcript_27472:120-659(+)